MLRELRQQRATPFDEVVAPAVEGAQAPVERPTQGVLGRRPMVVQQHQRVWRGVLRGVTHAGRAPEGEEGCCCAARVRGSEGVHCAWCPEASDVKAAAPRCVRCCAAAAPAPCQCTLCAAVRGVPSGVKPTTWHGLARRYTPHTRA